jgi:peptide/nickel transport system permease protein
VQLYYLLKRLLLLLLILWTAATVNFLVPRLSPRDPVRERMVQLSTQSGHLDAGLEEMIKAYQRKFGLDQPLWKQYLRYMGDMAHLDLGFSLSYYPKTVMELILERLPWTLGLLFVSSALGALLGSLLGALAAWPRSPKALKYFISPIMVSSAIPSYLFALILVHFLAFRLKWFPLGGGHTQGQIVMQGFTFYLDVFRHSVLPGLAIILTALGGWALGMRGMMVTVLGEDYVFLGQAKGLNPSRIFFRYGMRNALLPQVTGFGLMLAYMVSGSVLVETVFGYPGVGSLLAGAITLSDYYLMYGIVFVIILGIGFSTLILDLIYPLLDPRISYEGR